MFFSLLNANISSDFFVRAFIYKNIFRDLHKNLIAKIRFTNKKILNKTVVIHNTILWKYSSAKRRVSRKDRVLSCGIFFVGLLDEDEDEDDDPDTADDPINQTDLKVSCS